MQLPICGMIPPRSKRGMKSGLSVMVKGEIPMIYVINLEERTDRRAKVKKSLNSLGLSFTIIKAIDAKKLSKWKTSFNLTPPAQACWDSHVLAMQTFLKTSSSHALIFEDDVVLQRWDKVEKIILEKDHSDFDLLQFGFVNTGFIDRIHRNLVNFESIVFQLIYDLTRSQTTHSLQKRLRVSRREGMGFVLVAGDIRAGAQAYLISRALALSILQSPSTPLVPFDGLLMSLGWTSKFKVARTIRNLIPQDNSPSSIKGYF